MITVTVDINDEQLLPLIQVADMVLKLSLDIFKYKHFFRYLVFEHFFYNVVLKDSEYEKLCKYSSLIGFWLFCCKDQALALNTEKETNKFKLFIINCSAQLCTHMPVYRQL